MEQRRLKGGDGLLELCRGDDGQKTTQRCLLGVPASTKTAVLAHSCSVEARAILYHCDDADFPRPCTLQFYETIKLIKSAFNRRPGRPSAASNIFTSRADAIISDYNNHRSLQKLATALGLGTETHNCQDDVMMLISVLIVSTGSASPQALSLALSDHLVPGNQLPKKTWQEYVASRPHLDVQLNSDDQKNGFLYNYMT